jgi:hypothetical protein
MWDSMLKLYHQRRCMQDFLNLTMLVLASIASMCLGVLAAYAIFKSGFALMRWHTQQNAPAVAKASTEVARVS